MYYKNSVTYIRTILTERGIVSKEDPEATHTLEHILWMCDEIEQMSEWSFSKATKAARWIGWIYAALEEQCRSKGYDDLLWSNEDSRVRARWDVMEGYHLPKWCRVWHVVAIRL